ncbi:hypothetical protein MPSEU_000825500 [Mayamaea pseudoterrestris]|nr:hypothetical protein MPSEU_000825500 [Mayamaea pseudoterrestris]
MNSRSLKLNLSSSKYFFQESDRLSIRESHRLSIKFSVAPCESLRSFFWSKQNQRASRHHHSSFSHKKRFPVAASFMHVLEILLCLALRSKADAFVSHHKTSLQRDRRRSIIASPSPLAVATIDFNDSSHDEPFHVICLEPYWQQEPVLIRNAVPQNNAAVYSTSFQWPFFDWNDILRIAMDEETQDSARLVKHIPGKLNSFDLELAPFDKSVLKHFSTKTTSAATKKYKQTLLVNDVDRHVPALANWMDDCFSKQRNENEWSLPRWRRDDAQVSLAHVGGGIGPHVDQYDVLLFQASGQREWLIDASRRLTVREEVKQLIPDLSVRILQQPSTDNNNYTRIMLQPGDCLYLPPRVVHWGTAQSDQCMTLSIGFRAPSASDLVSQIAETLVSSVGKAANQRYMDHIAEPESNADEPSITPFIKARMKQLVLDAIHETMDDKLLWDELVGKLVTNPMRYSDALDYEPMDEAAASKLLGMVTRNEGSLRRAPGVSFATSRTPNMDDDVMVDRLFAAGQVWEIANDGNALSLFRSIELGYSLDGSDISGMSGELKQLLVEMLVEGVITYEKMTK